VNEFFLQTRLSGGCLRHWTQDQLACELALPKFGSQLGDAKAHPFHRPLCLPGLRRVLAVVVFRMLARPWPHLCGEIDWAVSRIASVEMAENKERRPQPRDRRNELHVIWVECLRQASPLTT